MSTCTVTYCFFSEILIVVQILISVQQRECAVYRTSIVHKKIKIIVFNVLQQETSAQSPHYQTKKDKS